MRCLPFRLYSICAHATAACSVIALAAPSASSASSSAASAAALYSLLHRLSFRPSFRQASAKLPPSFHRLRLHQVQAKLPKIGVLRCERATYLPTQLSVGSNSYLYTTVQAEVQGLPYADVRAGKPLDAAQTMALQADNR